MMSNVPFKSLTVRSFEGRYTGISATIIVAAMTNKTKAKQAIANGG
jgi:hypothetical protein